MTKIFQLLLVVFVLVACSEGNKKTDAVAETTNNKTVENPITGTESDPAIPTYDYAALEKEFFAEKGNPIYVVNFWATWCKPCVKELPAFEKLQAKYRNENVEVVLVSLDFPDHIETRVVPFIAEHGLKSRVVLLDDPDANSWIPAVDKEWSGAIPATVILKNGERKFYERSFTYEELENELKSIL
ncbi:MAG: TlpA family protein disulfide reductase [Flavobacteriaceae bacterium]|nr:TlpA family protein disulfide reductase [Flavobacteriaceae bacterium]